MGVNRVTKRGKVRFELRRKLPNGREFRKQFSVESIAMEIHHELEVAIARGTVDQVLERFEQKGPQPEMKVSGLADLYLGTYCRSHNTRPEFKEQALVSIRTLLGKVAVSEFSKTDADYFVQQRLNEVKPATVNRGLAVLKNMFQFAADRGLVEKNPMTRYRLLPEEGRALMIMTVEEERSLVDAVARRNRVIGAFVALLGETGLRKSEGLRLDWSHVDFEKRILTVVKSKNHQPRRVPLSDYAIDWLESLDRYMENPAVFALDQMRRLKDPRESFALGRTDAGLESVKGLHDLRHFRATQWLIQGVDINTVSYYLGHKTIQTTMRYLHFIPDHGEASVRRAFELEAARTRRRHLRLV